MSLKTWMKSIRCDIISACKTPFTHCLSQQSVCNAPKSSLKHSNSSSHCLIAAHTTAGTPATTACGLRASSRISNFRAFALYDATVLFLLGISRHKACANGPKLTAGNMTVPSTRRARSTAALCCSSGFSEYESCSRCCSVEKEAPPRLPSSKSIDNDY